MKRKLIKFSNYSFCITLPKKAVDALSWRKGETVDVSFDPRKKRIIVEKGGRRKKTNVKPSEGVKPIPKLRW